MPPLGAVPPAPLPPDSALLQALIAAEMRKRASDRGRESVAKVSSMSRELTHSVQRSGTAEGFHSGEGFTGCGL
jgi:hypothetical protein